MKKMPASHCRRRLLGPLLSGAGASPAPLVTLETEVRRGNHR
jgi:hypothetical protein